MARGKRRSRNGTTGRKTTAAVATATAEGTTERATVGTTVRHDEINKNAVYGKNTYVGDTTDGRTGAKTGMGQATRIASKKNEHKKCKTTSACSLEHCDRGTKYDGEQSPIYQ